MPLSTYDELVTSVTEWLEREDVATARIKDFISIAEKKVNRKLRVLEMESAGTLATVGGVDTVTLPARFLQMRDLTRQYGGYDIPMKSIVPAQSSKLSGDTSGMPTNYSIVGNTIRLYPTPDGVYTLDYVAYMADEELSDSNLTNILVPDYSDILLYQAVSVGWAFLMEEQKAAQWAQSAMIEIRNANITAKRARVGHQPSMTQEAAYIV